jgi:hypothetical protein
MSTRKFTKQLTAEWLEEMRKDLKPGDTLHTVIRGVAPSGMSRHIDVYSFTIEDGRIVKRWLSPRIAAVCGFTFDEKKECLRVSGCGMDMCHHVVYTLGRKLWPEGFGVEGNYPNGSKGRPTSREMAGKAVAAGATFYGRNGDKSGWDNDGGYALNQERL